jgi:cytochrome c-type biogenesis protein CcmH
MNLWLGITLILIVAGGFLAYPFFFRPAEGTSNKSEQANVDIFRDQQNQYQQQLERSEISQQQYAAMLAEAEQLLLSNTAITQAEQKAKSGLWMLPILIVTIPLATLWMYQSLGASADEQIAEKLTANASTNTGQKMAWDSELITLITERVKQRPNNVYYWTILAQEAVSRGDMPAAAEYFSQSLRIEPRESYLLGQYAQALFFADANQFSARVIVAMDNAFAVDSSNQTVLGLKGIQAFEGEDYKLAITYWQAAAKGLIPNSGDWQALQGGIQKARQLMGDLPAVQLAVALSIDATITFSPDQMVFVAVIEAGGTPMPLAARKLTASQLPINIVLSDNDALMEGRSLADANKVRVVARLSSSGTATPQPGDWEAISDIIDISADSLKINLNIAKQRSL